MTLVFHPMLVNASSQVFLAQTIKKPTRWSGSAVDTESVMFNISNPISLINMTNIYEINFKQIITNIYLSDKFFNYIHKLYIIRIL